MMVDGYTDTNVTVNEVKKKTDEEINTNMVSHNIIHYDTFYHSTRSRERER